ncbi:hypothetical protein GGI13_001435 [Coemansia sp. RSA 455]|nr:hypothetical protein GGI13_001435 [Coemansia sp. RSA 455]
MFTDNRWNASRAPIIVSARMEVATSAIQDGRPLDVQCSLAVDGISSFRLGVGSSAMLGVAACTAAAVETPDSSRASWRASWRRWTSTHGPTPTSALPGRLFLGPAVRVCACWNMAQSMFRRFSTPPALLAAACLAPQWPTLVERLGSNPTMMWDKTNKQWEIGCNSSYSTSLIANSQLTLYLAVH